MGITGKEIQELTDNDLLGLELAFGHQSYIKIKNKRDMLLRNKKIKKILNKK